MSRYGPDHEPLAHVPVGSRVQSSTSDDIPVPLTPGDTLVTRRAAARLASSSPGLRGQLIAQEASQIAQQVRELRPGESLVIHRRVQGRREPVLPYFSVTRYPPR